MKIKSISLILLVLLLTACENQKNVNISSAQNLIKVSTLKSYVGGSINDSVTVDNNVLNIELVPNGKEVDELYEIRLKFDKHKSEEFLADIMFSENKEVIETYTEAGEHCWNSINNNQICAKCMISEDGDVEYSDIIHNLNCPYVDGEHIFEYGYITSEQPRDMDKTAIEIAGEYGDSIAAYSCLSLGAWNALAGYEAELAEGCYNISFQAKYQDIPVTINLGAQRRKFSVEMVYAHNRMIQLQGPLFYSAAKEKQISQIVNPMQIIDSIKNDFTSYVASENSTVVINSMELEYFPTEVGGGGYLLVPVWNLNCLDTRYETTQSNESQKIELNYHCVYYAENGNLCGVFY